MHRMLVLAMMDVPTVATMAAVMTVARLMAAPVVSRTLGVMPVSRVGRGAGQSGAGDAENARKNETC